MLKCKLRQNGKSQFIDIIVDVHIHNCLSQI